MVRRDVHVHGEAKIRFTSVPGVVSIFRYSFLYFAGELPVVTVQWDQVPMLTAGPHKLRRGQEVRILPAASSLCQMLMTVKQKEAWETMLNFFVCFNSNIKRTKLGSDRSTLPSHAARV